MLHRKRHDLPSRLLTSKKMRSPDCLLESGSIPSNQIYHPISNLSLNANTSFISSGSSKSSNVVESNFEILESESLASQFQSQNSGYKKNITTSDKKGKRNKIGVNDCHNNHNNSPFARSEIRSKEVAAQSNTNSSQIKEKSILLMQSVPRDDSDSSDSEM